SVALVTDETAVLILVAGYGNLKAGAFHLQVAQFGHDAFGHLLTNHLADFADALGHFADVMQKLIFFGTEFRQALLAVLNAVQVFMRFFSVSQNAFDVSDVIATLELVDEFEAFLNLIQTLRAVLNLIGVAAQIER